MLHFHFHFPRQKNERAFLLSHATGRTGTCSDLAEKHLLPGLMFSWALGTAQTTCSYMKEMCHGDSALSSWKRAEIIHVSAQTAPALVLHPPSSHQESSIRAVGGF